MTPTGRARRRRSRPVVRVAATAATATALLLVDAAAALAAPPGGQETVNQVLGRATAWLVGILAAAATLFLTIGGIRYVLAGGDPGEVERAKAAFRSAAVGYTLAILAPVVVRILHWILWGR